MVGIKGVVIVDGCILCNLCEDTCPEVFTVTDKTSIVNQQAEQFFGAKAAQIAQAAEECPVEVIKIEHEHDTQT